MERATRPKTAIAEFWCLLTSPAVDIFNCVKYVGRHRPCPLFSSMHSPTSAVEFKIATCLIGVCTGEDQGSGEMIQTDHMILPWHLTTGLICACTGLILGLIGQEECYWRCSVSENLPFPAQSGQKSGLIRLKVWYVGGIGWEERQREVGGRVSGGVTRMLIHTLCVFVPYLPPTRLLNSTSLGNHSTPYPGNS